MYLKSSEIISKGSKSYLHIFFDEKYSYSIKENLVERDYYDLYFEEPNANDLIALRNCSLAINKLYKYITQTQSLTALKDIPADIIMAMMQKKVNEEIEFIKEENLEQEAKNRDITEEDEKKVLQSNLAYRSFMASLLEDSSDYSTADTDYFRELDKFVSFIDSKCKRLYNDSMLNTSLEIFDKYNAASFFIKKSIISEYVGFFFAQFPCQILHDQV